MKNIEEVFKRTNAVQLATGDQCLNYGDSVSSDLGPAEDCLQAAHEAGAKRVLLTMSSAGDLQNLPPELFATFQTSFYSSPVDAVFKALGVV